MNVVLLVYVFERNKPLIVEDEEIIGKEKKANLAGSGLFRPMIKDAKDLEEEEKMFNNKYNINNNMNYNSNPFMKSSMTNNNVFNNHIEHDTGTNDELHNVLLDKKNKKGEKEN